MKRVIRFAIFLVLAAAGYLLTTEIILPTWQRLCGNYVILADGIPPYTGKDYIIINNNKPEFDDEQLTTNTFVSFSPFDELGRTGSGIACLGPETLPKDPRGEIGNIQPSGWHTVRYDDLIEDKYLYNRSHVIGFFLSGDNNTPENLFTGTRYLNAGTMLQFEIKVGDYIEKTGNHVIYRVTPRYQDSDLVATGVQMEARSVEDRGTGLQFNVFVYNYQPGILIDYRTGESRRDPDYQKDVSRSILPSVSSDQNALSEENNAAQNATDEVDLSTVTYVLNTNTKRFHLPTCDSVMEMKPKNREYFYGNRDEVIAEGYVPCGRCKP